jgi:hypothetical protein
VRNVTQERTTLGRTVCKSIRRILQEYEAKGLRGAGGRSPLNTGDRSLNELAYHIIVSLDEVRYF